VIVAPQLKSSLTSIAGIILGSLLSFITFILVSTLIYVQKHANIFKQEYLKKALFIAELVGCLYPRKSALQNEK
jgi:hypothetical protein